MFRWPWSYNQIVIPDDEPLPVVGPPLPELDVIQRGEIAGRLLQDPVLATCFREIRSDGFKDWLNTDEGDTAGREEIYRVVQALEQVRSKLRAYRDAATVLAAQRANEMRSERAA